MNSLTDKNNFLSWRLGVIILLAALLAGAIYARVFIPGNMKPFFEIEGDAQLKVSAFDDGGGPIENLTLVATLPDANKIISNRINRTNENGEVIFFLRPGAYEIFVSDSNFPHELIYDAKHLKIEAVRGKLNEQKIILKRK